MGMSAQEGQDTDEYIKISYGIKLHKIFAKSHLGLTYDIDGDPIIRMVHHNSPPGMSGGGGSRKRGEAVNDELAVEISATGIYYINEKGEIIWYADINTSGGYGKIVTKDWMDEETAKAYFTDRMNKYSSLSTDLSWTSMGGGLGSGFISGVLTRSNIAALFVGGAVTLQTGVASIEAGKLANSYGNYKDFVSSGMISVTTIVYSPIPAGGVIIQYRQDYYSIGGGLIGSWTQTIRP